MPENGAYSENRTIELAESRHYRLSGKKNKKLMNGMKQKLNSILYEGKNHILYPFVTEYGETVELFFAKEKYADNKTLAVQALTKDLEPWNVITVNLRDTRQCQKNHAFFDINNSGWLLGQLKKFGIAKPAKDGYKHQSGFVTYPLYEWDVDKFREGGEKKKYYVDVQYHGEDGKVFDDMYYTFEVRPDTETEDLEEAKRTADEAAANDEFDSEYGVAEYMVVDEDGNALYSSVNVEQKTAKEKQIEADTYLDTNKSRAKGK